MTREVRRDEDGDEGLVGGMPIDSKEFFDALAAGRVNVAQGPAPGTEAAYAAWPQGLSEKIEDGTLFGEMTRRDDAAAQAVHEADNARRNLEESRNDAALRVARTFTVREGLQGAGPFTDAPDLRLHHEVTDTMLREEGERITRLYPPGSGLEGVVEGRID